MTKVSSFYLFEQINRIIIGRNWEDIMEKKSFALYTEEEREQLLMHWWFYYGKSIVSLEEVEQFRKLVREDSMLMKDAAMVAYSIGISTELLIMSMRSGTLAEHLEAVKETTSSDEYKMIESFLESEFLNEIVTTYNNPQPAVPFSQEEIVSQMIELVRERETVLTSKKVHDIYRRCLITGRERNNNDPTVDFIIGEGVNEFSLFSAERLDENKKKIITLIDELPNIGEGTSFLNMCYDKNGRQWTDDHYVVDLLVQLGVATGMLDYCVSREEWKTLPGGVPYVIRNRQNDKAKVFGKKPKEYGQAIDELKNGINK